MRFARLPFGKRSRLVQCFIEDVPASVAARLVFVNRKTANSWYTLIRRRLLIEIPLLPPILSRSRFLAYHSRRIAKFNGLRKSSQQQFLLESRLRYQLESHFGAAVLNAVDALLD